MDVYSASDYAGLYAGPYHFYYGYEFDRNEDGEFWGFRVTKDGKELFAMPYEYDERDTARTLLECIGIWIEKKYVK